MLKEETKSLHLAGSILCGQMLNAIAKNAQSVEWLLLLLLKGVRICEPRQITVSGFVPLPLPVYPALCCVDERRPVLKNSIALVSID